jgi:uncharacterized damage-inducible protein DinB
MPTLLEMRAAARMRSAADFAGTIRSCYPYWDAQYRPYLLEAVNAFPEAQLDYKPRPEMLTARQIIVHIAEAELGWVHAVIDGGRDEEWIVPADHPKDGWRTAIDAPDHAALRELLETWHKPTQRWLERSTDELGRVIHRRFNDGRERSYTVHWILDHLQEHEIHHRAQLNLYLRLLGIEPPSI